MWSVDIRGPLWRKKDIFISSLHLADAALKVRIIFLNTEFRSGYCSVFVRIKESQNTIAKPLLSPEMQRIPFTQISDYMEGPLRKTVHERTLKDLGVHALGHFPYESTLKYSPMQRFFSNTWLNSPWILMLKVPDPNHGCSLIWSNNWYILRTCRFIPQEYT